MLAGEKRAIARAISLVEDRDPVASELVRRLFPHTGGAVLAGLTGPPGVGKSSLIASLVGHLRATDLTVGVVSVDPSSPFTQGAVLGDRIRLTDHFLDPGVFIRSMSTRGYLGGVSEATLQALLVLDAAGKDVLLLETVGVGQSEVEVASVADTVVLVLQPGSGDSIQALKAGVMEIPDVIVINKADHPADADDALGDPLDPVAGASGARGSRRSSRPRRSTGEGVADLWDAVTRHREHLDATAGWPSGGGAASSTRSSPWPCRRCGGGCSRRSSATTRSSACWTTSTSGGSTR